MRATCIMGLVLFLLEVLPVAAQDQTLTGWFTFIVADYPSDTGLTSETTYFLTEDSGERHELLIESELMQPLGGPVALNRKRVTVVGEWESGGSDAPAQFWVSAIQLESPEGESAPLEGAYRALQAPSQAAVRGSQAWVTILCRFADARNVTPHPVSFYEKMTKSSYPALGHYWNEVSYRNLPDLNGSRTVGWYNLPRPHRYYVSDAEIDLDALLEDCTAVADADVFFPDFDGINVVLNQNFGRNPNNPHPAYGGSSWLTKDGRTRSWGVTWLPEWAHRQDTWAHEMGHGFGLMHSSGPYDGTYDSEWDVMSAGRSLDPYPGYGHLGVHTIAYHKDFLGWVPANRKYVARPNTTRTITLERLAQPDSDGYLMAEIPFGRSPTDFYTVEARLFAGYDGEIPDEAIVIHKVDTTRADRLAQVVDVDNNGDTNDDGAMWTVGEIFTDRKNKLQVSIDAAYASGYRVTINTDPATFSTCIDFLSASSHILGPGEDSASVQVKAASDCDWLARSNTEWIRVTYGSSSAGPGSVRYTVAANPSPAARTGTLTIGGWTFTVTQTSTHHTFFADDMESGADGWSPSPPWARTATSSRSGSWAWTDSPGGNYQNDVNTSLWSSESLPIDLTEVGSAILTFWHRYDFGSGDLGYVWALRETEDGSRHGKVVRTFVGTNLTWQQTSIDLTSFVGKRIRLSFQVSSDAAHTADGWYIDDVAVFSPDSVAYDACTHAVSPTRQVFGPLEGIASVAVEALRGCHWGAKSNSPWLRVTAGSSGSGSGRVSYSFVANPGSAARTGTLTIGGWTFTVIQAGVNDVLFEEDMENGADGWSASSCPPIAGAVCTRVPLPLTTNSSRSGTQALALRKNSQADNSPTSFWSPSIDLTQVTSAILTFWHRFDFGRDQEGNIWVFPEDTRSPDKPLGTFRGTQGSWEQVSLDLSRFVGTHIKLSFQALLQEGSADPGAYSWYIDDVAVVASDPVAEPLLAHLENPSAGSSQSGLGIISGWACEAQEIIIELAGTPVQAAYGTQRGDTESVCGDSNNGFSLLVNWNNLGQGEHAIRALTDGVEFARTTVRVTTLGVEFLRGVSGTFPLPNFPHPGDTTLVQWSESQQNFVITDGQPSTGGGHNRVAGLQATLENPSLGSPQSGIGIISGWVCEAQEVAIELAGTAVLAAYGTPRGDTQGVCGDSNNGFSLLVNWNNLGPGDHPVRALADGIEFARTTVRVTTLGVEFLREASGTYPLADFPRLGDTTTLRWEESLQNFVIIP